MTAGFRDKIEAAARARGLTLVAFLNGVVRDYLSTAEARAGAPHACCYCRPADDGTPNAAGFGRCCRCEQWGAPFAPRPGVPVRSLTRAG